jgi:hypothetical protein
MKRLFITAALIPFYLSFSIGEPTNFNNKPKQDKSYTEFFLSVAWVESNWRTYALGKDQDAGIVQITPIRLKDYNQQTGNNYTMQDVYNFQVSKEIFDFYCRGVDYEVAARRWNGGPNGMNKESTVIYWNKVKDALYNN